MNALPKVHRRSVAGLASSQVMWTLSRVLIGLAVAATGGMDRGAPAAEPASRPNVVVFLADDQGWGDLSVHGNAQLATPNIESLAREGALFDRF